MAFLINYFLIFLIGLGQVLARPEAVRTKIVGGEPATQGQIPYILSLQLNGQHHCGASIIQVQGLTLAISAAHCTLHVDGYNVTVVAGELKLSNVSGHEQRRTVSRIVNHDFNEMTNRNDISLLFIDEPFQFNENVRAVSLPPPGSTENGTVRVSGWGLTSQGDNSPSDNLMTVQIPVVDDTACAAAYNEALVEIYEDFLCAGVLNVGGVDSCQMDSGGPAVKDDELVGIVSFGIGCAMREFPGVYTETAYFLDWIDDQVSLYLKGTE